ncbi:WD40-repeat-containing domain protein [Elsinoe ampelina]|uniref:WD40-repeat-containing domain protein n=1 Tax=Elsinoe ampelina TaxID=302913 RepID=A0A6A6GQE0_9PEZI|nr:WD40-repeat-containing domain protein [Elsinoe ampelina]
MEIDEGERELERMIFGDSQSFRNNLKAFGQQERSLALAKEDNEGGEDDEDMEGMDDSDLFFTDTAGSAFPPSAHANGDISDDSDDAMDDTTNSRKPVWHDSDDERISVSLASVPRLRKLRTTVDEDVVSGKEYIKRLRKQYTLLHPTPDWATEALAQPPTKKRRLSASSDEDSDIDLSTAPLSSLLRSSESLTRTIPTSKKRKLPPTTLNIQRTPDLSPAHHGPVSTLTHHPTLPLLISSSHSTLHLYHLLPSPPAETPNPLLTSLHLKSIPLSTVLFHPSLPKIYLSSRRPYFHTWDLSSGHVQKTTRLLLPSGRKEKSFETLRLSPCGTYLAVLGSSKKGGEIHLLSASTHQLLHTARVEGNNGVADFQFWRDGRGVAILAKNGEVTEWDMASETVVARWQDQGAVGATVLALGGESGQAGKGAVIGSDRWVAVGSQSGVVNVYDRREWYVEWHAGGRKGPVVRAAPKPKRALEQLTTPVSCLVFDRGGGVLAMASRWKKDALRLVHLPSCTVYRNWPTKATPLGRVGGVVFGEVGGDGEGRGEGALGLWVGNEAGRVRGWEIRA